MILSLDGGKNVGYALFTGAGEEVRRGIVDYTEFFAHGRTFVVSDGELWFWIPDGSYPIDDLVVEGIRHNPKISQGGSQRWESQVEGAARILAAVTPVKLAVQPPAILPVAMIHDGYEKPVTRTGKPKHLPDEDAAWLHGRYYLRSVGLLD